MKKGSKRQPALPEVMNLACVFEAHRELSRAVQVDVMAGFDLSLSHTEVLVELLAAKTCPYWKPSAIHDGWVLMSDLKDRLVHDQVLLSRRVKVMKDEGFVERCTAVKAKIPEKKLVGIHKNAWVARLTDEGTKKITPVWDRYQALAKNLNKGMTSANRQIQFNVTRQYVELLRNSAAGTMLRKD